MQVTRVDIRLAQEVMTHVTAGKHLADWRGIIAYCNVYFDNNFVIKEVRVVGEIDGIKVSMPARKLSIRFACGHKNEFDHDFCSACGKPRTTADVPAEGVRRFLDVCHPTSQECRRHINEKVIVAVREQIARELEGKQ